MSSEENVRAARIWLRFEDGNEVIVAQTPRSLISAERKWGSMQKAPSIEATFYIAFTALKVTGISFDDWVNTIVDFEERSPEKDPPMADSSTSSESSEPA